MKKGKSAGPDRALPELIPNLGSLTLRTFLELSNLTWKTRVPHQWRNAEVILLLKNCLDSYSHISLVKLLRKWLNADFGSFWRQKAPNCGEIQSFGCCFEKGKFHDKVIYWNPWLGILTEDWDTKKRSGCRESDKKCHCKTGINFKAQGKFEVIQDKIVPTQNNNISDGDGMQWNKHRQTY
ncbi:hypothetical protein TNCV_838201 [Trichonephila clavipes]|nr:hypothetical protein TNCV_838201 [Trichonephila clavipes]